MDMIKEIHKSKLTGRLTLHRTRSTSKCNAITMDGIQWANVLSEKKKNGGGADICICLSIP